MLPFFPSPYPDELFYGICARYHQRSCHTSVGYTLLDLFRNRLATVTVDFPTNISSVSDQLSQRSKNTLDHLVNAHTLLPLYLPFLPKDRVTKIMDHIARKITGGNISMTIGATASAIPSIAFLRYCPSCLRDDRLNHGEPYWHRSHQVPGVGVCHLHQDRLLDSKVAAHGVGSNHDLFPLSGAVTPCKSPSGKLRELSHHVWLARSAHWLLNITPPLQPQGLDWLRSRYLHHLRKQTMAGVLGRPDWRELIRQFLDFYGSGFLVEVHSPLSLDSGDNWLLSLLRKPKKASHPLRHLLAIRFIGIGIEEFFCQDTDMAHKPAESSKSFRKHRADTPSFGKTSNNARRESWQRACAANPTAGVKELRLIDGADYFWLYRHDRKWLRSHSPHKPHSPIKGRVNWDKRDAWLAAHVIVVAKEILESTGRPVRITAGTIGKRLGATAFIEKLMDHLPRTRAALATVVESKDEFASRRLRLAAERMKHRGEPVRAWRLMKAAGLRPEYSVSLAEEIAKLA